MDWPALRRSFVFILCFLLLPLVQAALADATLAWDPDNNPSVVGYRLYAGTSSGVYTQTVEAGNNTSLVVSNLRAGSTYFFAVTAYTTSAESPRSNEDSFHTPAASPSPTPAPTTTPTPTPHQNATPTATPAPTA